MVVREHEYVAHAAAAGRKMRVAVVGGGPSGACAAETFAQVLLNRDDAVARRPTDRRVPSESRFLPEFRSIFHKKHGV